MTGGDGDGSHNNSKAAQLNGAPSSEAKSRQSDRQESLQKQSTSSLPTVSVFSENPLSNKLYCCSLLQKNQSSKDRLADEDEKKGDLALISQTLPESQPLGS